ncbi:hypothetical protein BDA96_10G270700 [Sorghum bicolor]|uniref:Uncharacterized protein n=1 Tax=Sorghum bicolor TaxID=4558 RepID=A0A921U2B1_SORBI|nr:hypothetical protein BDA96_10G270700 [Sorghum bicolor]
MAAWRREENNPWATGDRRFSFPSVVRSVASLARVTAAITHPSVPAERPSASRKDIHRLSLQATAMLRGILEPRRHSRGPCGGADRRCRRQQGVRRRLCLRDWAMVMGVAWLRPAVPATMGSGEAFGTV